MYEEVPSITGTLRGYEYKAEGYEVYVCAYAYAYGWVHHARGKQQHVPLVTRASSRTKLRHPRVKQEKGNLGSPI